jgi:hypothetical protein
MLRHSCFHISELSSRHLKEAGFDPLHILSASYRQKFIIKSLAQLASSNDSHLQP